MFSMVKKWLRRNPKTKASEPDYHMMEIDVVIKSCVSDQDNPFCVIFDVVKQGSFFTKDIFIKHVDERSRIELFYNYSTLGMNAEELNRFGGTDHAEYSFNTLEEAKKVKETTVQYIRYLIKEHQLEHEEEQKIS